MEITLEEYDCWRYPGFDASTILAKMTAVELSESFIDVLKTRGEAQSKHTRRIMPMNPFFPEQFALFCKKNIKITNTNTQYQSLPICIIDCVYSLRTKYNSVTVPIVHRYAAKYLESDIRNPDDTISTFINHLNTIGLRRFADEIVCNHQVLGGKAKIPKEQVCLTVATYLKCLNIETLEDFRNYSYPELLEIVLVGVKGLGDAGVNYLFMLAGDENRCKPDVHIHKSIKDACRCYVSNNECQQIYTEAVSILRADYPHLTVRDLDYAVWSHYRLK